jgi:beta-glucosidase
VTLAPGASKQVTLKIDPRSLSSVDEQGNRSILEGKYFLAVGGAQPEETPATAEAVFTVKGTAGLPK